MNFTVNEITNSIAGKPSLSECSVDELRQIASQYPFFGPAQFLYVKKLKEVDSWQLKEQIHKASLYFQNPLWLDHLLNGTAPAPVIVTMKEEEFIQQPVAEKEVPVRQEEVIDHSLNTTAYTPIAVAIKEEKFIPEPAAEMETPATQEELVDHSLNTAAEPPVAFTIKEEFITQTGAEVETPAMQEEVVDHSLNTAAEVPVALTIKEEEYIQEPAAEMETRATQEEVVDHSLNITDGAPVALTIKEEGYIQEPAAEMEVPATHEEVVDQAKHNTESDSVESENQTEQYQPQLLVEMPKFKFEPVDVSKTQLTFEPYHTIDYFASQGIRPTVEEKPKDQFSRQLKSFTEWLKVMKKLPVTEIAAAVSVVDEKKVEKMAELSINDREVVTEAMAEVWEKQGNPAKARETYEKLSLLNPGKSSYFAAKIEQLKNL